jgi:hypothetical protein
MVQVSTTSGVGISRGTKESCSIRIVCMSEEPKIEAIRYIVFLIDSKIKQHDGKVFVSLDEAREYIT